MAQLVLSQVGSFLGRRFAPEALQRLGASLGRRAGAELGRTIDAALFGPDQRVEGPRLEALRLQSSQEGASLPWVFGRARVVGQIIWASCFRERAEAERVSGGKGASASITRYKYSISFAIGLGEGPIARVDRAWANGVPIELSGYAHRLHLGTEEQSVDPAIEAIEGVGAAPAYRGLAYVVFEDFPMDEFGASLPQFAFEVVSASSGDANGLEALARGVCLIPGSGEFVYGAEPVARVIEDGRERTENAHAFADRANLLVSLDQLQADLPNVGAVSLVVSWFGDDLRCGACEIAPRVETRAKRTRPISWRVAGLDRRDAKETTRVDGAPAYGGTPADVTVLSAIAELKSRGLNVGLNPFLLMDIGADNVLPDPYGGARQAAYPWRGRISCSPAAGVPGSVDQSAAAASQVAAFFGSGEDWRYRRFILHYAELAKAAGGVDFFVIGSELRGLTHIRDAAGDFPAVAALRALAAEVRAVLGASVKIVYAADWSEYFGYRPDDGSGDHYFHLDSLWADAAIDAVAIDWYPPLTDWRDGPSHPDAELARTPYDKDYLAGRIEAGEAYDWYYAGAQDRADQHRTPIADALGKPWLFRAKDIRAWWSELHFDRLAGTERQTPTAWVPMSKPIWLNEIGVGAVDKGANAPNLFLDPKSAESAVPPYSSGARDDLAQRSALEAYLRYWTGPANPVSPLYGGPMIASDRILLWAWDARPFPHFPGREDVWTDGGAWRTGHWLNGRSGAAQLGVVVDALCRRAGVESFDVSQLRGVVQGMVLDAPTTARAALAPLMELHGFHVVASDDALIFRHDGDAPHVAISADELGASGIAFARADLSGRPRAARVRYLDGGRDDRLATAAAVRPDLPGEGEIDIEAPLVLDHGQAEAAARLALARVRAEAAKAETIVAPWRLDLEVGDRVALPGVDGLLRIARIEDAGAGRRLRLVGVAEDGAAPLSGGDVAVGGESIAARPHLIVLDLPPLPGGEADDRPLAAVFADPWVGPHEIYAGESRETASLRGLADRPAGVGRLLAPLAAGPVGRWDEANIARITLAGGPPANAPLASALAGANAFAVGRPDGDWEIIAAREAVMTGPEIYELRGLLRGLQGTECAPLPLDAPVVRLDGALVRLDLLDYERGGALLVLAPRQGRGRSDPDAAQLTFVAQDAWARPFAPAHLRGARLPNGDIALSWIRRARLGGDAWVGEPPLGEEAERYRVEVWDGERLLRSWTTPAPSQIYTIAEQQADFGGLAAAFRASVGQISARYGVGRRRDSFLAL